MRNCTCICLAVISRIFQLGRLLHELRNCAYTVSWTSCSAIRHRVSGKHGWLSTISHPSNMVFISQFYTCAWFWLISIMQEYFHSYDWTMDIALFNFIFSILILLICVRKVIGLVEPEEEITLCIGSDLNFTTVCGNYKQLTKLHLKVS